MAKIILKVLKWNTMFRPKDTDILHLAGNYVPMLVWPLKTHSRLGSLPCHVNLISNYFLIVATKGHNLHFENPCK